MSIYRARKNFAHSQNMLTALRKVTRRCSDKQNKDTCAFLRPNYIKWTNQNVTMLNQLTSYRRQKAHPSRPTSKNTSVLNPSRTNTTVQNTPYLFQSERSKQNAKSDHCIPHATTGKNKNNNNQPTNQTNQQKTDHHWNRGQREGLGGEVEGAQNWAGWGWGGVSIRAFLFCFLFEVVDK